MPAIISKLSAIVLAGGTFLVGCTHVAPYEREELSKPTMDMSHEEGEMAFRAHVQESREGSAGGAETSGGGCGCN